MSMYLSDVLTFLPEGKSFEETSEQKELNALFLWMYQRGILNDSWALKKTKNQMLFAVNVDVLRPYQSEMLDAFQGSTKTQQYISNMFDGTIPLCRHCGAFSLSQPMISKTMKNGEKEICCDCVSCKKRSANTLYQMGNILRLRGSHSAIQWAKEMSLYEN